MTTSIPPSSGVCELYVSDFNLTLLADLAARSPYPVTKSMGKHSIGIKIGGVDVGCIREPRRQSASVRLVAFDPLGTSIEPGDLRWVFRSSEGVLLRCCDVPTVTRVLLAHHEDLVRRESAFAALGHVADGRGGVKTPKPPKRKRGRPRKDVVSDVPVQPAARPAIKLPKRGG